MTGLARTRPTDRPRERAQRISRRALRATRHPRLARFRLLRRLGLRTRVTISFTLGALLLSAVLASATLYLTRQNLLQTRAENARRETYANAKRANDLLPEQPEPADIAAIVDNLRSSNAFILRYRNVFEVGDAGDTWRPSSAAEFDRPDVPQPLVDAVDAGQYSSMRTAVQGQPVLLLAVPLPKVSGAQFYEMVALGDIEDTLRSLGYILFGVAAATAGLGAVLGFWAAGRTVRPLAEVAAAADAIAGGHMETRLVPPGDRDLAVLASAFNEMAGALEERIERDNRFASEVSHELRSPLMTLTASVEVLVTRREELPERAQVAVDLLASDIDRFKQLVEDLLEISRFDVGTARLELDDINLVEFTRQAISRAATVPVPITYPADMADTIIRADKRRLARVLWNLVDNAAKYGDGVTGVDIDGDDETVRLAVEDEGPGVPPEERIVIFDRFSRGSAGGRRGTDSGVGLGLSLVTEHVHLHGGRVWVEDRRDGRSGARFVVELPIDPSPR